MKIHKLEKTLHTKKDNNIMKTSKLFQKRN